MDIAELTTFARTVEAEVQQRGYPRVTACPFRGHVLLKVDGERLARLRLSADGAMHLSYLRHTGRWEAMPPFVVTSPEEVARWVVDVLGSHIQALTEVSPEDNLSKSHGRKVDGQLRLFSLRIFRSQH